MTHWVVTECPLLSFRLLSFNVFQKFLNVFMFGVLHSAAGLIFLVRVSMGFDIYIRVFIESPKFESCTDLNAIQRLETVILRRGMIFACSKLLTIFLFVCVTDTKPVPHHAAPFRIDRKLSPDTFFITAATFTSSCDRQSVTKTSYLRSVRQ